MKRENPDGSLYTEINIKLQGSYRADIEIDGKKFSYGFNFNKPWHFTGLEEELEKDNTIGAAIARKVAGILPDILQGYMPDAYNKNDECFDTWEELPDKVADKVYRDIL